MYVIINMQFYLYINHLKFFKSWNHQN